MGFPVILCHGLDANRYLFDIQGAPSLADFLRRHGRDVWVAELRGSGMSDRPGIKHSDVPYSWGFEDHLRHDVPAIIEPGPLAYPAAPESTGWATAWGVC